jgi:hypothetical protein
MMILYLFNSAHYSIVLTKKFKPSEKRIEKRRRVLIESRKYSLNSRLVENRDYNCSW